MKTRREFLTEASAVPLAAVLSGPRSLTDGHDKPAQEAVYGGKPMSYWLTTLNRRDYDRSECDVGEQWMFRHFGDAAVPGLIEAMRDDSWFAAETELEMIGSPATVRALTLALKHGDRRVRVGSAMAMYGIGLHKSRFRPELVPAFREAFPVLAEVLKTEQETQVARMAGWILFEFGPKMFPSFPLPVKMSDYRNAGFWAQVIRRFPKRFQADEVVPPLISQLGNEDATIRLEVAQTLSLFDPDHPAIVPIFVEYATSRKHITAVEFSGLDRIVVKALPALRQALKNEAPKGRTSILHALGWSRSPAVIPTLAEGFDDEAWEARCQAVSSLYIADSHAAVPLLIRGLQDRNRYVRRRARWVFGHHRHFGLAALPELVGLLVKGDATVRASAALTLRDLGKEPERVHAALRQNLDHDDLDVRLEAAIAVSEMEPHTSELVHILAEGIDCQVHDLRSGAIEALKRAGRHAKAVLSQIINGLDHPGERDRLIWILEKLGPDAASAVPRLFEMMKEREAGTSVPFALGRIGSEAVPSLVEALRDRDLLIRSRAIRALGYMEDAAEQFLSTLIGYVRKGEPVVRIAAADALGNIGLKAAAALPALKDASNARDIGIRVHAERAKSQIESKITT